METVYRMAINIEINTPFIVHAFWFLNDFDLAISAISNLTAMNSFCFHLLQSPQQF